MKYNAKRVKKIKMQQKDNRAKHSNDGHTATAKESPMSKMAAKSIADGDTAAGRESSSHGAPNECNLDMRCFNAALNLSKELSGDENAEKALIDSLVVLQNDGIFALFIYLKSKINIDSKPSKKNVHAQIIASLSNFIKSLERISEEPDINNILNIFKANIVTNMDSMFFYLDICERTLIYAKYLIKSKGKA